jgi:fumarylpyruvate hydrolase
VTIPIAGVDRAMPVTRIFCVGRNYAAHAVEMQAPVDKSRDTPFYFTKSASAIVLSGATVPYPPGTRNYHHEMEWVVAIGAPAFRISAQDAGQVVFGYACGLDMTRRDLQQQGRAAGRPWDLGKDFEQSAVVSAIVPIARTGPISKGPIELRVNGARRQRGDLSDLVWSVPELIADLSRYYHLQPGDLLYTGTPEGVGPVEAGDRLEGTIAGIGRITLTIGAAQ